MDARAVDSLTEREREVLHLVNRHLTSKEIAPRLGISPDSVDARARRACRKLGVSDRGKAAALLAEYEETYQRLIYQSSDVDPSLDPATIREPVEQTVREVRTPFPYPLPPVAEAQAAAPHEGEQTNKLGPWQRLAIIAAIGIGSIVGLGAAISAMNGLVQLALSRHSF